MKKFFKYLLLFSLIFMLGFIFLYRERLCLYINISKKYYELKDNIAPVNANIEPTELVTPDFKDVIYKNTSNSSLTLDIYSAKKKLSKGSPVILYVHGGSWVYGDKSIPSIIAPLLDTLRDEGYTIISTSYELLRKDFNFEKQTSDIKDTIRWINKNKDIYGFNSDDIGILGTSSGAHLSLLAAYSGEDEFKGDSTLTTYSSKIKYIIDFFGPTDLTTLKMDDLTWDLNNIIKATKNKEQLMKKYSPINFVNTDIPNTLIIHSKDDKLVPYENATALYEKCKQSGADVKLITLENSGHDLSNISKEDILSLLNGLFKFIISNSPL